MSDQPKILLACPQILKDAQDGIKRAMVALEWPDDIPAAENELRLSLGLLETILTTQPKGTK